MTPLRNKEAVSLKSPIHFIGIGGSGMAPLAELCKAKGLHVSGSDWAASSQTQHLTNLGIKVYDHHDASHVQQAQTVIYSSAVREVNPELQASEKKGVPLLHRSDLLDIFLREKFAITIAGTHGKTTTSAMIVHVLESLGLAPSAAIGGKMLKNKSAALFGKGKYFVAEVDESDGSLVKYSPDIAVLTNIEGDHLDYFEDVTKLQELFLNYIQKTNSKDGAYVVGWDNPLCRDLVQSLDLDRVAFGFTLGCDVRALDYGVKNNILHFSAMVDKCKVDVKIPGIFGKHNVQNALAALATAHALELDPKAAAASLSNFQGVERRANIILDSSNYKLIDDYAHNPGKIRASISAVKEAWPQEKLSVLFEPHRYSRLQTMYQDLMSAFKGADAVAVLPVYAAGEDAPQKVYSLEEIAQAISEHSGVRSFPLADPTQNFANLLEKIPRPGIILNIGAGDSSKICYALRDYLNAHEETR